MFVDRVGPLGPLGTHLLARSRLWFYNSIGLLTFALSTMPSKTNDCHRAPIYLAGLAGLADLVRLSGKAAATLDAPS